MSERQLRILDRSQVARCLEEVDPVAVVEAVLRRHADGLTVLPPEGYLPWRNERAGDCRALAMLGGLTGDADRPPVYGLKAINAATSNPGRGLERAGGVGMVFDPDTARPVMLAEVGLVSALRTAAYTVLSIRTLGPVRWTSLALIGCGTQASVHLDLIGRHFPHLATVRVYDRDRARAESFALQARQRHPELAVEVADTPGAATSRSEVVVTLTTSTVPYLEPDSFLDGAFVAHVSLDDLNSRTLLAAAAVWVDDVGLIEENPRRILGRLMQDGLVLAPGTAAQPPARALDGTLGDVLTGRLAARWPGTGVVVSNPFGMAVLDVGLLEVIRLRAEELTIGLEVDLMAGQRELI